GVRRDRRDRVAADALRGIEADVTAVREACRTAVDTSAADERWPQRRADSEIERREIGEQAGTRSLRHAGVAQRGAPAVSLLPRLDAALDVEPPRGDVRFEQQRLEGDRYFNGPSGCRADRGGAPHAVPVRVLALPDAAHERIVARAVGVDGERVATAAVAERVQHEHDVVLIPEVRVAHAREGADL